MFTMKNSFDINVIKTKQLDKETILRISKNEISNRFFVEFSAISGKLVVQKSFQDTFSGREQMKEFSKSIKNIKDLQKYFGVK